MSQTDTLLPPIDAVVEIETVCFDYGQVLAQAETILSIDSVTCSVVEGTDEDHDDRLIGSAQIAASPTTQAPLAAVLQKVGTMIAGCVYRLEVVVLTSSGQHLSLWSHLECKEPD